MEVKPFFKRAAVRDKSTVVQPTFVKSMIEKGAPVFLSGLIGILSGFWAAQFAWESTEKKTYLDLRMKHADDVSRQFAVYWLNWNRMYIQCKHRDTMDEKAKALAAEGKLSEEDLLKAKKDFDSRNARLGDLARTRNVARDSLYGTMGALRLYFSSAVIGKASAFENWDRTFEVAECKDLPPADTWNAAWDSHRNGLLELIRQEFQPGRAKLSRVQHD